MPQEFLNTKQAAEYLGLKPNTLDIWRQVGKGPAFVKVGRYVRYRRRDIDTWIESRVRCSTSETA